MNEKKKITRKTVWKVFFIVYALISICFTTLFIDGLLSRDYSDISQFETLTDGWDVTINDRAWQDVSLDDFRFDPVNKGDTITMTRIFPADTDCIGHALVLQIRQSAVTVYLDGEPIHTYGWDRIDRRKTVGSGYLPVDLPDNYAGKTLTLELTAAEDKDFCLLEYLTLYLAPIPLVIYMREDVLALNRPVMYAVYQILLALQIFATTLFLGLHAVDLVHCAATLKYMQVLILCNLLYFIIVEFMNLRVSRQLVHRLFLIGMLALSGCVGYDLLFYYFDRYRGISISSTKGIASVGLVVFIFLLLVSFYINLTQKMMQETERNFLIKSAYTDELTQIHNRRYCMEYMNGIKDMENPRYTVFCFDLNNLKTTNDTFGHAQGDILIRNAAEVIVDAFESHGIVARMGGDEFIAIAETDDSEKISAIIGEFRNNIQRKNEEIPNLNLSIAFGYASCSPKEYNIEKIYQIADDRMYENKQATKKAIAT